MYPNLSPLPVVLEKYISELTYLEMHTYTIIASELPFYVPYKADFLTNKRVNYRLQFKTQFKSSKWWFITLT